ncbi:MAG: bifunctional folylpolyglutamate synthase/dihydrofolate synthase [Flavobacteriales bacterium]|nr:bifunctional folylpolyglutamate synthase/dihydrofolate synthase [Flavobacteriales bacterium]
MTYAETLAYLYARLPMYQRIGASAYKADLSNTHALMEALGHPERWLKCVHVAGTNGKGSTSSLIASALQEAGYKVGLHTSPHLKDFRERFRINGTMVNDESVTRFVEEHRSAFEPIEPSFFEWGVAFALWWFREQQVDIAVIETGMGGRLDSTNVVTPEVSVITNIGWDHQQFLGGTLVKIAAEKAGIIKTGIPVVIGEAGGEVADVFKQKALESSSPITFVDQHSALHVASALPGQHQERNGRTALAALDVLRERGWRIPEAAVRSGFGNVVANTGLRGRWEVIGQAPLTIADVAHNVDGMRAMNALLQRTQHEKLHIVLGMVNDKDIDAVLELLPTGANYYFCKADIPRGLDAGALRTRGGGLGLSGISHPSVRKALTAARRTAGEHDLVLVTGSVFVVAEAL